METKEMNESVGLGHCAVTETSGVRNIFCLWPFKVWNCLLQFTHREAAVRYLIGVKIPEIGKKGREKNGCESRPRLCLRDAFTRNNFWVCSVRVSLGGDLSCRKWCSFLPRHRTSNQQVWNFDRCANQLKVSPPPERKPFLGKGQLG